MVGLLGVESICIRPGLWMEEAETGPPDGVAEPGRGRTGEAAVLGSRGRRGRAAPDLRRRGLGAGNLVRGEEGERRRSAPPTPMINCDRKQKGRRPEGGGGPAGLLEGAGEKAGVRALGPGTAHRQTGRPTHSGLVQTGGLCGLTDRMRPAW